MGRSVSCSVEGSHIIVSLTWAAVKAITEDNPAEVKEGATIVLLEMFERRKARGVSRQELVPVGELPFGNYYCKKCGDLDFETPENGQVEIPDNCEDCRALLSLKLIA